MTREELAAIRARVEAATPGEWKMDWDTRPYHRDGMPWCTFAIGPRHGVPADPSASAAAKAISNDAAKARNADATFIAHARQDVLRLCAEVARLTAEVERLSAMVPRWVPRQMTEVATVWTLRCGGALVAGSGVSTLAGVPTVMETHTTLVHQDLPTACAAVCRRLGLRDILPPTENT